jgi:hypothetical protein
VKISSSCNDCDKLETTDNNMLQDEIIHQIYVDDQLQNDTIIENLEFGQEFKKKII